MVNKIKSKMSVHPFSSKNPAYFSSVLHKRLTDENALMHTS